MVSTPDRPFTIVVQPSLIDSSRAPEGKHTGWAYCHVPGGSTLDRTDVIERQVERFAPGFRDRILARHVMNTADLEQYNPNYVGGAITGGVTDLGQLFTRPVARVDPYSTPNPDIFICSASAPPGGGVHGMCGYHAARSALRRLATGLCEDWAMILVVFRSRNRPDGDLEEYARRSKRLHELVAAASRLHLHRELRDSRRRGGVPRALRER